MASFEFMKKTVEERGIDRLNEKLVYELVCNMGEHWERVSEKVFQGALRYNAVMRRPLVFKEYEVGQDFYRIHRPPVVFKDKDTKEEYKLSRKLLERYEGPYKILHKVSPILYDADVEGVVTRVHAHNMKPG